MIENVLTDAEVATIQATQTAGQSAAGAGAGAFPLSKPHETYDKKITRQEHKMLLRSAVSDAGRVFQDGTLTFGAYTISWSNGDTLVVKAAVAAQALTDNETNYIYYTDAGVLTVNITGFPVQSVTSHLPLAEILTASGTYAYGDITDKRQPSFISVPGSAAGGLNALDWQESVADELDFTAAEPAAPTLGDRYLNTGTGASSVTAQTVAANDIEEWNGTSWTEITPDEGACCLVEDRDMLIGYNGASWVDIGTFALLKEAQEFFAATDITGAEAEELTDGSTTTKHIHGVAGLAAAVQDLMPNILLVGADATGGIGTCTLTVRDAANNPLAGHYLLRIWVANTDYDEADVQTGFDTLEGIKMRVIEANADLEVITVAAGTAEVEIDAGGAATRYVMAELDGKTYSSGAINITV